MSQSIVWRVQPEEHLRAIRVLKQHHGRRTRRLWRELAVIAAIAVLALVFALLTQHWRARGKLPLADAVWLVTPLLLTVLWFGTRPWALSRAVREQLRHNKATQQERRYTLDPTSGLSIAGDTFLVELGWHQIEAVRETPEFFLFLARKTAYYLPKRAIVWPNRLDDVRELLRGALNARAVVRG